MLPVSGSSGAWRKRNFPCLDSLIPSTNIFDVFFILFSSPTYSVCVSLCVYVYVCLCMCVFLCVRICICMRVYEWVSVCEYVCVCMCISVSLCISSSKELIRTAPPKAVEENKEGIICKIGHTALGTLYRNRLPSFLLAYPKATHFITPLREHRSARVLRLASCLRGGATSQVSGSVYFLLL